MIRTKMQLKGTNLKISESQSGVNPTGTAMGPVRLSTSPTAQKFGHRLGSL